MTESRHAMCATPFAAETHEFVRAIADGYLFRERATGIHVAVSPAGMVASWCRNVSGHRTVAAAPDGGRPGPAVSGTPPAVLPQGRPRPQEAAGTLATWRGAFAADPAAAAPPPGYRRLRRRLVTGRRDTFSRFRPSRKTGRMVAYESLLERTAAILLEEAREVSDYLEQPASESWDDAGTPRRYTADFGALTALGIAYVEVKPRRLARRPGTMARHRAVREALHARGIGFVVWTEREMARPARAIALLLCAARRAERDRRA